MRAGAVIRSNTVSDDEITEDAYIHGKTESTIACGIDLGEFGLIPYHDLLKLLLK